MGRDVNNGMNKAAMTRGNRIWLIAPVWLWLAGDVALTLAGQSDAYWNGDYSAADELNPLAYPFVARGPWVFACMATMWGMFFGLLVACVSHPLIRWLALVSATSNAIGGCTWLVRLGSWSWWGWVLAVLYLFVAAEASWWCWRRSGWASKHVNAELLRKTCEYAGNSEGDRDKIP